MRIAVVNTQIPFSTGGAEFHATNLIAQLRDRGHDVELITLPFSWYPATKLRDCALAARRLDISEYNGKPIDIAICLRFPAYLVRHPRKVLWILHQHRALYDLYGTPYGDAFLHNESRTLRQWLLDLETTAIRESVARFANSRTVTRRFPPQIAGLIQPLYHPEPRHQGPSEPPAAPDPTPLVFAPSRIEPIKRQHLLLLALTYCPQLHLLITGFEGDRNYAETCHGIISAYKLSRRVTIRSGVSRQFITESYTRARATAFVPFSEDYGYITLESFALGRPLLTTTDSGGPNEFVLHGYNGLVAQPNPRSLGEKLSQLRDSPELAASLGRNARTSHRQLNMQWAQTIQTLLGPS